jgi:hypothetical protein
VIGGETNHTSGCVFVYSTGTADWRYNNLGSARPFGPGFLVSFLGPGPLILPHLLMTNNLDVQTSGGYYIIDKTSRHT